MIKINESVKKQLIKTESLLDHYCNCLGLINTPEIDTDTLAWVFVYMRFFTIKDIRLGLRHNYQTKDIAHLQSELSMALARVFHNTFHNAFLHQEKDGSVDRILIRNIINFNPRGGGNGDELRLFILDLMRRHGIREGHRPGIDDPFLEKWHQKLHSNCTPEDITICEAYIVFQETDSHDLFYQTLWDKGGISVDFLKNMACPLPHLPRYMPQIIPDLKHLLWILKQIHGGSHNFSYLLEVSKWQFDQELFSMLKEVKNNFGAWWLPGKIMDCRHRLKRFWQSDCPRDPLMIDVALDNIYKASIEQIDLAHLKGDDIISLLSLTLQNIQLSYLPETSLGSNLWQRIQDAPEQNKWTPEWGLQALAALNYIQGMLHSNTDELYEIIQPKAEVLGKQLGISESYCINFAEEVIRSQNSFALSKCIDALFPMLRETAGIGCWKIISHGQGKASGIIKGAESLLPFQGKQEAKPHILLVDTIDGQEDIPDWVSAILTTSDVDILSHISIRCRNAKVLLATCYEQDFLEHIKLSEGKTITVSIENDTIRWNDAIEYNEAILEESEEGEVILEEAEGEKKAKIPLYKKDTTPEKKSCTKSGNLLHLKERVSDFIKTPSSVTIPWEAFTKTLEKNREAKSLLNQLYSELSSHHQDYRSILSRIREVITSLIIPADIVQLIQEKMGSQGPFQVQWSETLAEDITSHIKKVWASVWNERAYLSRFSRKQKNDHPRMGVLIQEVIPADYSFVIHTRNPLSNNSNEILSEIAVGLGETLAGNSPGAPLCVISTKKERNHTIKSYPSKSTAYFDPHQEHAYIIRSDSNDEDLADFAGAGLYDSYFINKPVHTLIDYEKEKLFWNKEFHCFLFDSLLKIAEEIEDIKQYPQDIEGVYYNDTFYVVQTRDQVGVRQLNPR